MSLCGRQGGLERYPGGWAQGPRGVVGYVYAGSAAIGGMGVIGVGNGLNSPVYLMTLDRLKERS